MAVFLESPYTFRQSASAGHFKPTKEHEFEYEELLRNCRQVRRGELEAIVGRPQEAEPVSASDLEAALIKPYISDATAKDKTKDDGTAYVLFEFGCRVKKHEGDHGKAWVAQYADGSVAAGCHAAGCPVNDEGSKGLTRLLDALEKGWRHIPALVALTTPPMNYALFRPASEIAMAPVEWIWRNWLPRGMLTIVEGEQATTKSMLTLDWAMRIARGEDWNGLPCGRQGHVLICSQEEHQTVTTIPRLRAMGANEEDLARIHVAGLDIRVDGKDELFSLPRHTKFLADQMRVWRPSLVIIDPLFGYVRFDGGKSSNTDPDVRVLVTPLKALAERWNCAFILIRHWNKDTKQKRGYRGVGSQAIGALVRTSLSVEAYTEEEDEDRRILRCVNTRLVKRPEAVCYKIISKTVRMGDRLEDVGCIEWLPHLKAPKLSTRGPEAVAAERAKDFLYDVLQPLGEWKAAADIEQQARRAGISDRKRGKSLLFNDGYKVESKGRGDQHLLRLVEVVMPF